MQCKKQWIWICLVVWVIGVFVGRWGLVASSGDDYVVEQKNDADGGSIDKGGWMAFGLAVQEMSYQGAGASYKERWNEGKDSGFEGAFSQVTKELQKRILRCKITKKIVSSKRLITYYVFGLCKLLD